MSEVSKREHTLEDIRQIIRKFVEERDWQGFQKPSALAISIAIETGELLEMFQWLADEEIRDLIQTRNGGYAMVGIERTDTQALN